MEEVTEMGSRSTSELIGEAGRTAAELAKKELLLAKSEAKEDLRKEIAMAGGFGVGGVCVLLTIAMLLVAAAMGLGTVMAEWLAALLVAGAVLIVGAIAAAIGWAVRAKEPLSVTRRTLKEDARWAKERLA